jgi:hypothetical protein
LKPAAAFQAAANLRSKRRHNQAMSPSRRRRRTRRRRRDRPAAQPRSAKERHAAKPTVDAQTARPAPRKTARRDRTAKPPTNEALNTVRSLSDNLRDIPVSSYAADGTSRRIVIRPTSIQDVYYYSR